MKIALLSMAMIGSQLATPVGDRVPRLNVEATCKATVADDKAMGLVLAQTYDACMRDENAAQRQLMSVWSNRSDAIRNQCEGEATAAGMDSYVDLLTCLQMTDSVNVASSAVRLRGASKNRNNK